MVVKIRHKINSFVTNTKKCVMTWCKLLNILHHINSTENLSKYAMAIKLKKNLVLYAKSREN